MAKKPSCSSDAKSLSKLFRSHFFALDGSEFTEDFTVCLQKHLDFWVDLWKADPYASQGILQASVKMTWPKKSANEVAGIAKSMKHMLSSIRFKKARITSGVKNPALLDFLARVEPDLPVQLPIKSRASTSTKKQTTPSAASTAFEVAALYGVRCVPEEDLLVQSQNPELSQQTEDFSVQPLSQYTIESSQDDGPGRLIQANNGQSSASAPQKNCPKASDGPVSLAPARDGQVIPAPQARDGLVISAPQSNFKCGPQSSSAAERSQDSEANCGYYFDHAEMRMIRTAHDSTGQVQLTKSVMKPGQDGFALAEFEDGHVQPTEIPNLELFPVAAMKRPAAAMKQPDAEGLARPSKPGLEQPFKRPAAATQPLAASEQDAAMEPASDEEREDAEGLERPCKPGLKEPAAESSYELKLTIAGLEKPAQNTVVLGCGTTVKIGQFTAKSYITFRSPGSEKFTLLIGCEDKRAVRAGKHHHSVMANLWTWLTALQTLPEKAECSKKLQDFLNAEDPTVQDTK
jgi:hypothetical protein